MLDEFKKLKRWLRANCKFNYDQQRFVDYGWSFKSIAEYLGTSLKKAFDTIKRAIEQGIISKTKKIWHTKIFEYACIDDLPCTFVSHGMIFKVFANSYSINGVGII